jgi:hypothetical protein
MNKVKKALLVVGLGLGFGMNIGLAHADSYAWMSCFELNKYCDNGNGVERACLLYASKCEEF